MLDAIRKDLVRIHESAHEGPVDLKTWPHLGQAVALLTLWRQRCAFQHAALDADAPTPVGLCGDCAAEEAAFLVRLDDAGEALDDVAAALVED